MKSSDENIYPKKRYVNGVIVRKHLDGMLEVQHDELPNKTIGIVVVDAKHKHIVGEYISFEVVRIGKNSIDAHAIANNQ
jgi:hypothetical protein